MKERLVIDLDGVILEEGNDWTDYQFRKPLPGIIEKLTNLSSKYSITIMTARRSEDSFWLTIKQLQDLGLDKIVERVLFDKPRAILYVDDLASKELPVD